MKTEMETFTDNKGKVHPFELVPSAEGETILYVDAATFEDIEALCGLYRAHGQWDDNSLSEILKQLGIAIPAVGRVVIAKMPSSDSTMVQ